MRRSNQRKWKAGQRLILIVTAIYLCFVALSSMSSNKMPKEKADGKPATGISAGKDTVDFVAGSFDKDLQTLTVTVNPGETALLSEFTGLRSVDLSGSTCYDEIIQWAAAHPNVSVQYDVQFPGGIKATGNAETLELSGIDDAGLNSAAGLFGYLPNLKNVDLGKGSENAGISPEVLGAVIGSHPELSFHYSFSILGREVPLDAQTLDLSGLSHDEAVGAVPYFACLHSLSEVELGRQGDSDITLEDIKSLSSACPATAFKYTMSLYGVEFNLADETLDLNHIKMDDEGAAVREVISCMPNLKTLDMDYCGVSNQAMAGIRSEFPNVDVIWRVWFGDKYSVRTDAERILASKPTVGGPLTNRDSEALSYCTKVKYLDLGHNPDIGDFSFLGNMPDLEVLIAAMTAITDISGLANCPKIEYLELMTTNVADLSPLTGITSLRHLNIRNMPYLTDISVLFNMPDLERVYIGKETPIPAEQVAQLQAAAPGCVINTTLYQDEEGDWRFTGWNIDVGTYYWVPRYEELRWQLGYNYQDYSFYWLDDKCGDPCPPQYAGMYGRQAMGYAGDEDPRTSAHNYG